MRGGFFFFFFAEASVAQSNCTIWHSTSAKRYLHVSKWKSTICESGQKEDSPACWCASPGLCLWLDSLLRANGVAGWEGPVRSGLPDNESSLEEKDQFYEVSFTPLENMFANQFETFCSTHWAICNCLMASQVYLHSLSLLVIWNTFSSGLNEFNDMQLQWLGKTTLNFHW